jgi:hypothetical protein
MTGHVSRCGALPQLHTSLWQKLVPVAQKHDILSGCLSWQSPSPHPSLPVRCFTQLSDQLAVGLSYLCQEASWLPWQKKNTSRHYAGLVSFFFPF